MFHWTSSLKLASPPRNFIFSLPGIIGASVAFSGLAGKSSASGKVQEVAALSAGPLQLGKRKRSQQ